MKVKSAQKRHRQWKTRRQLIEHPEALRRWDQVYQYLLNWNTPVPPDNLTPPTLTTPAKAFHNPLHLQEAKDEPSGSALCQSFD